MTAFYVADVTVFDGGHFYLNQHLDAVAELMSK